MKLVDQKFEENMKRKDELEIADQADRPGLRRKPEAEKPEWFARSHSGFWLPLASGSYPFLFLFLLLIPQHGTA